MTLPITQWEHITLAFTSDIYPSIVSRLNHFVYLSHLGHIWSVSIWSYPLRCTSGPDELNCIGGMQLFILKKIHPSLSNMLRCLYRTTLTFLVLKHL